VDSAWDPLSGGSLPTSGHAHLVTVTGGIGTEWGSEPSGMGSEQGCNPLSRA
jgi:hypothetical protein